MNNRPTNTGTRLIGLVGVDSGQLLLTDPCYLSDFESDNYTGTPTEANSNGLFPYSYSGACAATLSTRMAGGLAFRLGHEGAGVAFSTGWGDGLYPVYVTYSDEGRIASVEVRFIEDEDFADEDEDFEGDEDAA